MKQQEISDLIIAIIRLIFFLVSLIISLIIFYIYAALKLDDNAYYSLSNLSYSQSEEIKKLIGLSDFPSITIKTFKHNLTNGTDTFYNYYFDTAIAENEYQFFCDYITEMPPTDYRGKDHKIILEENSLVKNESTYELLIYYSVRDGGDIHRYIVSQCKMRHSRNVWVLLPQLILLLLGNTLIILPYKSIFTFIKGKKVSP